MNTVKTVLSAEDDVNDAFLLRRAFETAGCTCRLFQVPDGQEALDYLNGHNGYWDRGRNPFPDLFLLDLNMPRMGGLEVLKQLQDSGKFELLPRIVLSSSRLEVDKSTAEELGACAYFVKLVHFSGLVRLVSGLEAEWLANRRTSMDPGSQCEIRGVEQNGKRGFRRQRSAAIRRGWLREAPVRPANGGGRRAERKMSRRGRRCL